jgi:hypothetical protein
VNLVNLSWYIYGMLGLLIVLGSLVSVPPEGQAFFAVVMVVAGCGSLGFACLAIHFARLPRNHWVHSSRSVLGLFMVLASVVTFLGLLSIG